MFGGPESGEIVLGFICREESEYRVRRADCIGKKSLYAILPDKNIAVSFVKHCVWVAV
jgi:hypothetical protein